MAQANLKRLKDEATQEGARTPVSLEPLSSDEWIRLGSTSLRNARRLDVDAVLARSLPKASGNVSRISANEGSSSMKE